VSLEIIMTTSVTRPCFTTQHQTCKTKTKTKTKTDFLVSDWSCPKTDGLRPHHWLSENNTLIKQQDPRQSRVRKCSSTKDPPSVRGSRNSADLRPRKRTGPQSAHLCRGQN